MEVATYRAVLDLYRSDLLPEDRYEKWTEGRRDELRQLYLTLLVELAGLYEECHEYDLAIEVLRKATATEPTLEEAHVAQMRLYALSGRPKRALAQYESYRDTLSRGLGTQPGALASSEFVSQPTLARLSIPVQHSSASAISREHSF
jgi:two-component SAPR family response regulator